MKRLLMIEPDQVYGDNLSNRLSDYGFLVDYHDSPIKGLELLAINRYVIVISNLDLEQISGLDFCRSVKNISPNTICIILSDKQDDSSEMLSIDYAIDLFFKKEKSIDLLLKYIEKMSKSSEDIQYHDDILFSKDDDIKLYVDEHIVKKGNRQVLLTPKEFELLRLFLSNQNKVLSREDIVNKIWEEPMDDVEIRLVDPHIKRLRDKLKCSSLRTVRGYGYRWLSSK